MRDVIYTLLSPVHISASVVHMLHCGPRVLLIFTTVSLIVIDKLLVLLSLNHCTGIIRINCKVQSVLKIVFLKTSSTLFLFSPDYKHVGMKNGECGDIYTLLFKHEARSFLCSSYLHCRV